MKAKKKNNVIKIILFTVMAVILCAVGYVAIGATQGKIKFGNTEIVSDKEMKKMQEEAKGTGNKVIIQDGK